MRTDAIRLTQKQQAQLRRRAVWLRENGNTNAEVAQILNVHKKTVSGWWAAYGRVGHALFEPGKRGRRVGDQRRLTAEQEREVCRLIAERMPDRLELPFALWNWSAVGKLIERRYAIVLPVRTLGEYLRRWGYTSKRPQVRAGERTDRAMQTWLAETYPMIVRGARREGAQLFWGDQTEVIGEPAQPITLSMMRAVTNRGAVRFLVYSELVNTVLLVSFCGRLIASAEGRTVYLILDHLPVYCAGAFRQWTDEHRHEFTVYCLPTIRN